MLFTRISVVVLTFISFGMAACSSGGGTQDPAPGIAGQSSSSGSSRSSASSSGAAIACAYNDTRFSPATGGAALIRLELEHYDDCGLEVDSTPGNNGGALREGDVDIFAFDGGGYWVGDTQTGESLNYTITVPKAGFYDLTLRVLSPFPSSQLDALITIAASGRDLPATEITVSAQTNSDWRDIILPLSYFSEGLQQLQIRVMEGGLGLDYLDWQYAEESQSPAATVAGMGIGINLGNTLDAPVEGEWAPAAERRFLEDFAEAGFGHVRIPVTWDKHVSTTEPYTISPVFLERVEQVVDWGLAQGLYVILNAHHESWLKEHYSDPDRRARFAALWRQVATHMQQKPERLIFEILNEPVGMTATDVDQLNSTMLAILRESNPTRTVVFSGNGFTPVDSLLSAAVPDDPHLIGNFHSYDPWPFAGQCTRSWGSTEDRAQLAAIYQKAADWSARTAIPVMVNEFGAAHYDYLLPQNVCDPQARLEYLSAHVEQARAKGIAATVWDDNGSFQIYRRQQGTWGEEKAVLLDRR
jgi:endoglucanase